MTQQHKAIGAQDVLEEAAQLGLSLGQDQAGQLAAYLNLLTKWNRAMNLVGRTGWPLLFRDLAADSLHLERFLPELGAQESAVSLDLGAGAGLPGIPLRIVWQAGEYVLVELREKRAVFLRTAVAALKLPRTRVVHGHAEEAPAALAGLSLPQRADLVLSRAFMPWPKLLPLASELLSAGGRLVILANEPPPEGFGAPDGLAGFRLLAARAYPSGNKTRYFWGLAPAMSSM